MAREARHGSGTEIWMAWVRLLAVPFALLEVGVFKEDYPSGYQRWGWAATATLAAGGLLFFWLSRRRASTARWKRIGFAALVFDTAIVYAYVLIYSFEPGTPIRQLVFIPLVEAALRYGLRGGLLLPLASAPVLASFEWWRIERFGPADYELDYVTFPVGVQLLLGLIVGWLVNRLRGQTILAATRAAEAEELRDQLGRRADLLDATNRCARALSSSLDLEQAFAAFIRELRGLVSFDRMAIVLAEDGGARVIAAAGAGAERVFPQGSRQPIPGSVLEEVLETAQTVYREDISDRRHPEEVQLLELGLRCRLAAPLLVGARAIGMLAVVRAQPASFTQEEIELVGLLGRFLGTAVQNIRAYDAERKTVEELRRLSALRADFVSLVSHELRSPMASVIGSARTLQQRWRELSVHQRESFLSLIEHETSRLAALIGDVLDTSRIEAGTFSYSFSDVDLAELVRESVATAETGQDEVRVRAVVQDGLPSISGDEERLRQVLVNLIDNAVKYSPAGDEVEVAAHADDSRLRVEVRDRGPGIAPEDQKVIFEKFGRVNVGDKTKPGTGLGLFIARSIAEAHGGSLEVRSAPDQGAVFTLSLPL